MNFLRHVSYTNYLYYTLLNYNYIKQTLQTLFVITNFTSRFFYHRQWTTKTNDLILQNLNKYNRKINITTFSSLVISLPLLNRTLSLTQSNSNSNRLFNKILPSTLLNNQRWFVISSWLSTQSMTYQLNFNVYLMFLLNFNSIYLKSLKELIQIITYPSLPLSQINWGTFCHNVKFL